MATLLKPMLKPQKVQDYLRKVGELKDLGGYPNPVLIFNKILKRHDWILNRELASQSTVTENQISRIRTGKVDDCKTSDLFKQLAVLPPSIQVEFATELQRLWVYFNEIVEYDPEMLRELLGDAPPEIGT